MIIDYATIPQKHFPQTPEERAELHQANMAAAQKSILEAMKQFMTASAELGLAVEVAAASANNILVTVDELVAGGVEI